MNAHLRAFTIGELLDGAFSLYRRNFSSFFMTALVPQLPLIVMWLLVPVFAGSAGPGVTNSMALLFLPYSGFAAILLWGALVFASMRAFEGASLTAGDALRAALRKLPALIVGSIVALVLITCGFLLFVIPGLILAAMFFAVVPAIVVEDRPPFESLGRSRRLSKGARLRVLGVITLATLIAGLPMIAFSMIAGVATAAAMARAGELPAISLGGQALVQAASLVLGALTTPYSVAAITLLYVDRRARTEAPDLEAAAARLPGM